MNSETSRDHEEFLERILTGELDPDSPEARKRLDADPELAQALLRCRGAQNALDRVAQADAEILERARNEVRDDDRTQVRGAFRQQRRSSRMARFLRPAWLAVAAALLVLGIVATRPWWGGERPFSSQFLGDEACIAPRGEVTSFEEFVVDAEIPRWGKMVIRVLDAEDGREVLRSPELDSTTWIPSAEVLVPLPRSIHWSYEILDVDGSPRQSGSCKARRSE